METILFSGIRSRDDAIKIARSAGMVLIVVMSIKFLITMWVFLGTDTWLHYNWSFILISVVLVVLMVCCGSLIWLIQSRMAAVVVFPVVIWEALIPAYNLILYHPRFTNVFGLIGVVLSIWLALASIRALEATFKAHSNKFKKIQNNA